MITKFYIFENEEVKILQKGKRKFFSLDIYEYRNIVFFFNKEKKLFYLDSSANQESFDLGNYIAKKEWDGETDMGNYSSNYELGSTLEEVKKSIDDYYMNKELKKFNL
jgi:hypothetical protein